MPSFQDHQGLEMYIDEAGACDTATAVVVFAGNWPAVEQRICYLNKQYRQVKNLPKTATMWHASTDKLAGTTVEGIEGN